MEFEQQLIRNQKALRILEEQEKNFPASAIRYRHNVARLAGTALMIAEKNKITDPTEILIFDGYTYQRNKDDYIQLQTTILYNVIKCRNAEGYPVPDVNQESFNQDKIAIKKAEFSTISEVLQKKPYTLEEAQLLKDGWETIKINLVSSDCPPSRAKVQGALGFFSVI